MRKKKNSIEIIDEIAQSLGYKTKYLSTTAIPKRLMVSNGKKMCVLNSSIFGWYPEVQRWQQHLFDSKSLTQEVLENLGYNTIHTVKIHHKKYPTFRLLQKQVIDGIKKYPVIVKPEKGFKGNNISIAPTKQVLKKILKAHYKKKVNVLLQPIIHDDEYRILVIGGKVHVVHIKKWHKVVGDNKSTLKTLLGKVKPIEKDEVFIKQQLRLRKLSLSTVLKKDETFPYHLTRFSSPEDYFESKKIPVKVARWAEKLSKDISSPTMGIDIFAPKGLLEPQSYIVIELNANPAFDYIEKRYGDPDAMKKVIVDTLEHYFKK